MYKSVVYTTIRVEIKHEQPFDTKQQLLEDWCDVIDFNQDQITDDGHVIYTEWCDDEVVEMNRLDLSY